MLVQLFLDCVDRASASSTEFVSFRDQPMHFKDNQTLNLRVVDPVADERAWAIKDDGCNSCCHFEVWRQIAAKMKMKVFWPSTQLGTQKGNYFQWRWNEHDKWEVEDLRGHTTARIRQVIRGCVHSHEIPEKTHPLLLSQACQAKLGMMKRVRDGSITLDDHDAQSLEVARQVGTGLLMIRITSFYIQRLCVQSSFE